MNRLLEYTPDMEFLDPALSHAGSDQNNLHAAMAFGAGLLEVSNDAELVRFLADLVSFVGAAAGNTPAAPLRLSLVRVLARAAHRRYRPDQPNAWSIKTSAACRFCVRPDPLRS